MNQITEAKTFLSSVDITEKLDASGLNCPLPILRTKIAINKLEPGQILEITATDPGSVKDMESFCQQTGNTLMFVSEPLESKASYTFFIRKN